MATKKNTASAAAAGKIIVAFMLCDYVDDGGVVDVTYTEGQRLELTPDEFNNFADRDLCVKGVFVKMLTSVEGGKYSLKPHDNTWLAPHVYEAWKAAGYCEPADASALAEARVSLDVALARCADLEQRLQGAELEFAAAGAQAEKVRVMIEPAPDSGDVLDDDGVALLEQALVLTGMFPDQAPG